MLINPLLPENDVCEILAGVCELFNNRAEERGIKVNRLKTDYRLPTPIGGHADIQCCSLSKGVIFSTSDILISNYEVIKIADEPTNKYPGDCLLNSFRLGSNIICGNYPSKEIIEFAEKNKLKLIMTNQGYAKCSCAIIDEHAIITADRSIANALIDFCDVLLIRPGSIELPGYSYGFIGGACGKAAKDELWFFGNPLSHPDGKEIVSFAEKRDCDIISLKNGNLFDFGGFIPLFEEEKGCS